MRLRRHILPAPARRLMRDAGPPNTWVLTAFLAGAPIIGLALVASGATRLLLVIVWIAILTAPSILDRDGRRIWIGMAWLAAEQRRRLQAPLGMPRTAAGADRWLEQPAARGAGLTRASVLLIAGRTRDARQLVESHPVEGLEDRARVARMLAAIDGLENGRVDPTVAEAAIEALPADAQSYHRLSLAWSTAWVEAVNKRPWRRAFARAADGIGLNGIPLRYLAYGAFQELLAPIIGLFLVVIVTIVGWP